MQCTVLTTCSLDDLPAVLSVMLDMFKKHRHPGTNEAFSARDCVEAFLDWNLLENDTYKIARVKVVFDSISRDDVMSIVARSSRWYWCHKRIVLAASVEHLRWSLMRSAWLRCTSIDKM